jgi:hypothetical protein
VPFFVRLVDDQSPPVLSDLITYISVLWLSCSIQCFFVYPLIGYLSYRDSKLNVRFALFFVHQEVLPFFLLWITLDTSPYGHENLAIILCWGPKHKMIVKFWWQVLTNTCTKILEKVGKGWDGVNMISLLQLSIGLRILYFNNLHWGLYHEFSVLWPNKFH